MANRGCSEWMYCILCAYIICILCRYCIYCILFCMTALRRNGEGVKILKS